MQINIVRGLNLCEHGCGCCAFHGRAPSAIVLLTLSHLSSASLQTSHALLSPLVPHSAEAAGDTLSRKRKTFSESAMGVIELEGPFWGAARRHGSADCSKTTAAQQP